jgi:hypothetical protein
VTDQNLPSATRDAGSKKGSAKKEEVGAVDNYSRIDLDLLPKSLGFTSRLLRFGAEPWCTTCCSTREQPRSGIRADCQLEVCVYQFTLL